MACPTSSIASSGGSGTSLSALYPRSRMAGCTANMLDAHAHLADACFGMEAEEETDTVDHRLSDVIAQAISCGVHRAVMVPQTASESRTALARARAFPHFLRPAGGVHPVSFSMMGPRARATEQEDIAAFIHQHHAALVCIGEAGLDFSPWILQQAASTCRAELAAAAVTSGDAAACVATAATPDGGDWKTQFNADEDQAQRSAQVELLRLQVRLAVQYGLSLNLHSRNASTHVLALLAAEGVGLGMGPLGATGHTIPVLLHAFDGSTKTLQEALRRGYYVSATTSLGRDPQMKKALSTVLRESPFVEVARPDQSQLDTTASREASLSCPAAATAAILTPSSPLVSIPSVLLQLVLETDSPALHPIKQPPPSAVAASAESSVASSCCPAGAELNVPSNLYIALLELFGVYVAAEEAREKDRQAQLQKRVKAAERKARLAAEAGEAAPASPTAADSTPASPSLSMHQLACLLYANSLRLFPRAK